MKKTVKIVSAVALVASIGFASSTLAASGIPDLYVYSVVGGTPGGQATGTLVGAEAGPGSTVNPITLPYSMTTNANKPVTIQNGLQKGTVSASLTYNIAIPVNGGQKATCVVEVKSSDIGLPATAANGVATVVSGGSLCTSFFVPVSTVNGQDGDQVITINWKSNF